MEDNEGVQEKEEVNLGKLQYSIDYDFTQGEVSYSHTLFKELSSVLTG